ncbi:MAG: diphthine--ammonia ligase [Longimicrobiaceae bacterium]
MKREPVVIGWSGGKDSVLALQELLRGERYRVAALLTTLTEGYDRISVHGVRRELLHRQAASLELPLAEVWIPPECSNQLYEERMSGALNRQRERGVRRAVFGDLFLQDVRAYRERLLERAGVEAVFPLWGRDTGELARAFVDDGFQARVVCVDSEQIDPSFAGRPYDHAFLADLPESADWCGENGEFHTFVHAGPLFRAPVPLGMGERVLRQARFQYCDLLPVPPPDQ